MYLFNPHVKPEHGKDNILTISTLKLNMKS